VQRVFRSTDNSASGFAVEGSCHPDAHSGKYEIALDRLSLQTFENVIQFSAGATMAIGLAKLEE